MFEAVICEPVRTPVGRYGGVFKDTSVKHLAATVVRGLVERTGITTEDVDDVIFGQGYANGEAAAIGRIAALDAGLERLAASGELERLMRQPRRWLYGTVAASFVAFMAGGGAGCLSTGVFDGCHLPLATTPQCERQEQRQQPQGGRH